MRKILAIVLTIIILLMTSVLVPSAFALGTPKIKVSQVTADPGETVDIAISLENNPGIISMTLKVDYDSDLTLIKVTDTGLLPGKAHKATLSNPYTLTWANDTALKNYTDDGNIVILTFKVKNNADINSKKDISVSYSKENYDIYNKDIEVVNFKVVNGGVSTKTVIENCDCICHKDGFLKFLWNILRFFDRIFDINKTCKCGAFHY